MGPGDPHLTVSHATISYPAVSPLRALWLSSLSWPHLPQGG